VSECLILMFKIFHYALYLLQVWNMIFFQFKLLWAILRAEKAAPFLAGPGCHLASLRCSKWCKIQTDILKVRFDKTLLYTQFFFNPNDKTFRIFWAFQQLSCSVVWRVVMLHSLPHVSPMAISTVTGWFTFDDRKSHCFGRVCSTFTRQPIVLESCSNPLQIQKVFKFRLKQTFFVLGVWLSLDDVIMRACFRRFDQVYLALGDNPTSHFLAQLFWKLGYHPNLYSPWWSF